MLVATVYLLPLILLALKLRTEAAAGAVPHGAPVPLRFAVVGLFSLLMSKWCVDWMKERRRST
ncbi:MAG: hypothetical protein ISP90_01490 [Nevskia sp.]|nr:hypothetical protein [Nevskia sp.]